MAPPKSWTLCRPSDFRFQRSGSTGANWSWSTAGSRSRNLPADCYGCRCHPNQTKQWPARHRQSDDHRRSARDSPWLGRRDDGQWDATGNNIFSRKVYFGGPAPGRDGSRRAAQRNTCSMDIFVNGEAFRHFLARPRAHSRWPAIRPDARAGSGRISGGSSAAHEQSQCDDLQERRGAGQSACRRSTR